jgi:hypothetical protein
VSVRLVFMHLCVKKMHWCLKCRKQASNWSSNIDGYSIGHHRPGIDWTLGTVPSSNELKLCRTLTLRAFIPSAIRPSIHKPRSSPTNVPICPLTKALSQHFTYSRINSTMSPASGAGNVIEPRLMSNVGRVCEVVRA